MRPLIRLPSGSSVGPQGLGPRSAVGDLFDGCEAGAVEAPDMGEGGMYGTARLDGAADIGAARNQHVAAVPQAFDLRGQGEVRADRAPSLVHHRVATLVGAAEALRQPGGERAAEVVRQQIGQRSDVAGRERGVKLPPRNEDGGIGGLDGGGGAEGHDLVPSMEGGRDRTVDTKERREHPDTIIRVSLASLRNGTLQSSRHDVGAARAGDGTGGGIAEAGSFVAAGRRLGVSPSALGKAIAATEERLNARLFHRTTRSVALTEEGALYLDHCRRVLSEVDDAEAALARSAEGVAGTIRLGAPSAYGRLRIVPPLARFLIAHPEARVDLRLADRVLDPLEERLDLVVRIGRLADSGMRAWAFDHVRIGLLRPVR